MKYLSLVLLLFILVACNNNYKSNKKQSNDDVISLGKIITPESLQLIHLDSIEPLRDYKIIIFFNGMCSVCIGEAYKWSNLLISKDLYLFANIMFITYTEEIELLQYYFERDNFNYPVYFDADSTFIKLNKIQDNHIAFITDSNDNIVYKGDLLKEPVSIFNFIDTTDNEK
jgi:hypothetical protein